MEFPLTLERINARDVELIQIADQAMSEAARRSGSWLICKPGCTQCCHGSFEITALDAHRLRRGLLDLTAADPGRAGRVRQRAVESFKRIAAELHNPKEPSEGHARSAVNQSDAASLAAKEVFGTESPQVDTAARLEVDVDDNDPCPALDPATGTCDLYEWRPMTCRVFGPPVRVEPEGIGVCELCFQGATEQQIAECLVDPDPDGMESEILTALEQMSGFHGPTSVAEALIAEGPAVEARRN